MDGFMKHRFVGFGFGPIQAGLFAAEACGSGAFGEIAIAEIDSDLVAAVRGNGDAYCVNVAGRDRVETVQVEGVRLLNPRNPEDRRELADRLARATEIVTSLPSVDVYNLGEQSSVAALIADGLQMGDHDPVVIYTAENNNHAAEILDRCVHDRLSGGRGPRLCQFLNTVIGKMSQVILDPGEIARRELAPIVPGLHRAFLVEQFNHILVSRIDLSGFSPGISVFEEKPDLLPFEEAKLYGHNAIHAMLGFLGKSRGCTAMAELRNEQDLMELAREAFIREAGAALVRKHGRTGDRLFTQEGVADYAEDLLERMTNPHLGDAIDRIIRDPLRKLGARDRIFGAIRLCLEQGIVPTSLLAGAREGLKCLLQTSGLDGCPLPSSAAERDRTEAETKALLVWLWQGEVSESETSRLTDLIARE